jgi:phosphoserine phosphatase
MSLAFFDMDGTLLRGESQLSFLLWALRRGIIPRGRALRVIAEYGLYVGGLSGNASRVRKVGCALFKGLSLVTMGTILDDYWRIRLNSQIRRHSRWLLQCHRAQQHELVLITSACKIVAQPVFWDFQMDVPTPSRKCSWGGGMNMWLAA